MGLDYWKSLINEILRHNLHSNHQLNGGGNINLIVFSPYMSLRRVPVNR
jgi:hypothetical protein